MTKKIILCADDYSQNIDICEGILGLLDKNRLNAVSCLVNSENWHETHKPLLSLKNKVSIGLQLNFTLGKPLSAQWKNHYGEIFPGLLPLLRRSYTAGYIKDIIACEINAQVNAFIQAIGRCPDFIDGHQHVHQLPRICEILIELHTSKGWTGFIRNTHNGISDYLTLTAFPKRQLIALLGGNTFKNRLINKKIPTNSSFAGIYDFKKASNYNSIRRTDYVPSRNAFDRQK